MSILDSIRRRSAVARRIFLAPATLVLAAALFGIVVLLRHDVLPDEATLIVSPAFGIALLTDAILYNDFGLRGTRPPLWLLLAPALYLQAAVLVALGRSVRRRY